MKKIILFVVIVMSCFSSRTFAQCAPDNTPPTLVCNLPQLLTNPSFEIGTLNNVQGAGPGWSPFGVAPFALDATIPGQGPMQDGQYYLKIFGGNSGIFQDVPIGAGDQVKGSVYLQNRSVDPIPAGGKGIIKLEFLDAGNTQISFAEAFIDNTTPQNVWQLVTVNAIAPANAVTVRLVLASAINGPGAAFFDDASLINVSAGSAGNLVLNNDPGECGAVVDFADAIANDNCPGAITVVQTAGLPGGSLFPIGTTNNTFLATDASGNTASCSFDITVSDTEAPTFVCGTPSNLLSNPSFEIGTGNNIQGAGPGWSPFGVAPFALDATIGGQGPMQDGQFYLKIFGGNSGIFQDVPISGGDQVEGSVYLQNRSVDPIPAGGKGIIRLEFLDAGNAQISSFEDFIDNTTPQNVWQLVTVNATAPANAVTVRIVLASAINGPGAAFFDNATLDNVSVPSGTNPTYPNDPGECGATINYPVPVGMDNCPGAVTVLTSGLGSGSFFPVGTHIESYLVTDNAGLSATCDLTITVEDTEGPVIVCNPTDLLSNGGFETGTANNTPGAGNSWQVYGNVFSLDFNNPTPQAGQFFIKTFAANSGVFQDAAISGGDELLATGYVLNATFDPMLPGCFGRVKIEFFDAGMGFISVVETSVDHTIPSGVWQKLTVSATAPANATTARFVFAENCTGGGAVFFDSGSLINLTAGSAGNISVSNDPGACGAIVEFADATSADNCGAPVLQTAGLPSGSLFPIGTTTNTYVATDASGNTSTCSFDVTVTDNEAPFILCGTPSNLLTNASFEIGTAFNQAGAGPGWTGFGVPAFGIDANIIPPMQDGQIYLKIFGGNSGIFQDVAISGGDLITASVYVLNASFDPIPAGGQGFVKIEFRDAGNNQISFTETSVDNSLPSNVWTLVTVNATAPANAVTARFVLAASTPPGPGAVFFDDASLGNASVPSGTNPTFPNDPGQCGAIVNYQVPVGTDNCPGAVTTLTSGIGSGGFFPTGTHIETYTVTDNSGLTATCDLTITVEDKEGPALVCNPTELLTNRSFESGTSNNTPGAGNNWSQFGPVFALGPQPPFTNAQSGNFFIKIFGGNSGVFQDAPVSGGDQLAASAYIQNAAFDPMLPGCTGFIKLEFFDAGGGFISFVESNKLDNTLPQGVWTQVTINTTAPANAATARFVMIMQCNAGGAVMFDSGSLLNLTAGSSGNISLSNDPGACGAVVEFADALASDNCPGAINVVQTAGLPSGSSFPIGTTTITFEGTDIVGNTSTCSFDVTVTDAEGPSLVCTPPTNSLTNSSFEDAAFNVPYSSPDWTTFGPLFGIDATILGPPQDGDFYLKTLGVSGVFQDLPVSPGDQLLGSGYFQNASFDPAGIGTRGVVKFEYFNAGGGFISFSESDVTNTATNSPLPSNTWVQVIHTDIAPAGAATVRFVLVAVNTTGALMMDDASFTNVSNLVSTAIPNDPGQCGATYNYPIPTAIDNCPGVTVTLVNGQGSGTFFPIGTHTETYMATDASGMTATCDFTFTVEDTEAPVIECSRSNLLSNASFEIGTSHNAPFVGPDWSFFQFAGGAAFSLDANIIPPMQDGNFYLKIFGGSGILQDVAISGGDQLEASAYLQNASFDPIIPGCRGIVKLEFVDAGGGVISFVEDDVDFTLPQNIWTKVTVNGTAPANATTARFVLVSVCLSGGAVMYDDASLINLSVAGSANITAESDPGVCGAVISYQTPTFTDNCPGGSIVQTTGLGSGATFPVGTTTETYIATDAKGNTSVCTFDVTINDTEAPIIDCGSPNLLSNGDFEAGGGQNTPCATDYICFGGVFQLDDAVQGSARSGDRFMKLFGGNTGIFQDIPISGGDPLFAEVYVQNASFDPMLPGCNVFIKFEYFDSNNGFISAIESPKLDHTIPSDVWVPLTFSHTAPANAVKVRAIAFLQCNAGGATMIDDFRLNNLNDPSSTPYTLSLDPVTGSATLLGTDFGLNVTDNCAVVSYNLSKSVFTCVDFLTNPNQVTLTVSDAAGNTASCVVDVIVDPNPNPGLDGTVDVCETGAPISLFNFLNGTPDQVGVWSGPSAPTGGPAGIYDPATMTPGIYTHSVFSTAPGCSCFKAIVVVTETPAPDAGTSTNVDVCGNDAPTSLFDKLGGMPETGGIWSGPSPLGNGDRGMFDPATASPGVYTYTLNSPGCAPASATVTVNVLMEPMIPSVADIMACDGDPTDIVPTPMAGMSFNFYDADPTAGGANLLAGPTASYDPGTQVGNTTSVWVTTDNGNCESDPIKVDVTVNALPNAMASSNSPLFVGMTMNLMASGGTSYAWTGPNGFSSTLQNPSKANVALADCGVFSMTATDQNGCSKTVTIAVLAIPANLRSQVSPSMILEGPYDAATGLMRDDLRTQQLIPLTEPYTALGFTHTGGGERISPATLAVTGNNAIVDWVLVELRDANNPQTLVGTRAALLQRDGDVVDTDGVSPVAFPNISIPSGNYHISVRHRNHFGAMTLSTLSVSPANPAVADFSNVNTSTWGTGATMPLNGSAVLMSGNTLQDGLLKYSGPLNDRAPILQAIGGLDPTQVISGYHKEDVNLDGTVKYSGPVNDRAPILNNVGGIDPTAIKIEQLP